MRIFKELMLLHNIEITRLQSNIAQVRKIFISKFNILLFFKYLAKLLFRTILFVGKEIANLPGNTFATRPRI